MGDRIYLYAGEIQATLEGSAMAWFCVKVVDKTDASAEVEEILDKHGEGDIVLGVDPDEGTGSMFSFGPVGLQGEEATQVIQSERMAPDGARSVLEDARWREANRNPTLEVHGSEHGVSDTNPTGDPTDPHGTQRR